MRPRVLFEPMQVHSCTLWLAKVKENGSYAQRVAAISLTGDIFSCECFREA